MLLLLLCPRCPANNTITVFSLNTECQRRKVSWCQASIIFAVEEAKAFFSSFFFYLTALLTLTALAVENRGGLCVRDGSKLKLWLIYLLCQGFHFTVFRKATPVCRWQRRFLFSWVHLKLSGVFKVLTWDHLASVDFFNRVYSCGRSNSSGARTLKYVRKTKEPEMKMLRGITQEKV